MWGGRNCISALILTCMPASKVASVMSDCTVALQAPLSVEFSRQNTGVGCYSLFQGIVPTQGWNLGLLRLLLWQEGSLPLCRPLGSCTRGIFSCKTCGVLKGCHGASLGPHITVCLNVQASVFLILQVLGP